MHFKTMSRQDSNISFLYSWYVMSAFFTCVNVSYYSFVVLWCTTCTNKTIVLEPFPYVFLVGFV